MAHRIKIDNFFSLLNTFFIFVVLSHLSACTLIFVGQIQGDEDENWIEANGYDVTD